MSNERATPMKTLEKLEKQYGTQQELVHKLVTLSQYDVEERQKIEHILEMFEKVRVGIEMYNLGYKHGSEDGPTGAGDNGNHVK